MKYSRLYVGAGKGQHGGHSHSLNYNIIYYIRRIYEAAKERPTP